MSGLLFFQILFPHYNSVRQNVKKTPLRQDKPEGGSVRKRKASLTEKEEPI
jgi:hypothetical protein